MTMNRMKKDWESECGGGGNKEWDKVESEKRNVTTLVSISAIKLDYCDELCGWMLKSIFV